MNVNDDFMIDDLLLDAPPTEGGEGSSSLLPSPSYPPSQPAPSSPSFRSPTRSPWDPRLLMDLALMVDSEEDILARYDLTQSALISCCRILRFAGSWSFFAATWRATAQHSERRRECRLSPTFQSLTLW